ncbi:MAG TPA: O-antigen ligase family protein [Chloroflexota bacterium]
MALGDAGRWPRLPGLARPLARGQLRLAVEGGSAPSLAAVGAVGAVGAGLGVCTLGISSLPSPWPPLLVVAALCPFVALVTGHVRRLLLAAVLLDIPFQVGKHLGYRRDADELGALPGWDVSLTTIALAALYAIWLAELLARTPGRPRPAVGASLAPLAYLAFVGLSMLAAADATLASFEFLLLVQTFLLYLYLVSSVRTRSDVVFVATLLLVGLAAEGLLMAAMRVAGQSSIGGILGRFDAGDVARGHVDRLGGTIGSSNAAASYLSLLLAPALSLLLTPLGRWHKRLALLGLALGGVALVMTLSRGGWIAFALSLALFCLLAHRRGWLPLTAPLVCAVVVVAAGLLFQDAIVGRLADDDNGSAHSRLPLMRLALRIIADQPLLGIGANNYSLVMTDYVTPDFSDYGGEWLYIVHNKYLLVWAETGLGGLIAFLCYLLATIWAGWRGWQLRDRLLSPLALGLTAAIVGHLVHMSVDLFSGRPQAQTLWTCAALLVAIGRVGRERRESPAEARRRGADNWRRPAVAAPAAALGAPAGGGRR